MEDTQSFRLAGTTEIQKIPIQHIDGQSVVYWESIEQAFPGAKQVKNGNVTIPRCIKSFPGVVLDVVLSNATGHLDVDSSVGASSVIPPTAVLATAPTVDLTDDPVGSTDAPINLSTDLPVEDKLVEGLRVASASAEMPIGDSRAHASLTGSSVLPPTSHSDIKAVSKTAMSFQHVVQLAARKAKEHNSQVQMQELSANMAHMIKLQNAFDAKQEMFDAKQEKMNQLQNQR
ncbi:hypothetical protein BGZ98_000967 [Dissophora globulifera]|nr:hypothetical protein BGZ98_000967 [Dissophora globulifera]